MQLRKTTNQREMIMLRRILFEMGLVSWCESGKGIVRHCNEGFTRPLLNLPPILHTVHEGIDWEIVE